MLLLEPNQLNVQLHTFTDNKKSGEITDIRTTQNGKPRDEKDIMNDLANVSGSDGHGALMNKLRHGAAVGVTKDLQNIMIITDDSGNSTLQRQTPVQINGVVWAVFVDQEEEGHDEMARKYGINMKEDDIQDYISGKYGTYIYQFTTNGQEEDE